jgi:hypothetical protein
MTRQSGRKRRFSQKRCLKQWNRAWRIAGILVEKSELTGSIGAGFALGLCVILPFHSLCLMTQRMPAVLRIGSSRCP